MRRIRSRPLLPLLSTRWSRWDMLYRVWYSDRQGLACSCLAVATAFQGFTVEDERRDTMIAGTPPPTARSASFPWASATCSVVGCVAIGLLYWTTPYNRMNLPDALYGVGLLLVAVAAGLLQFFQPRRWLLTLVIMTLAPVGAVAVRIVVDVARDPTSHNLFPFELAIAGVAGGLAVSLGMGIGWLARRLVPRPAV